MKTKSIFGIKKLVIHLDIDVEHLTIISYIFLNVSAGHLKSEEITTWLKIKLQASNQSAMNVELDLLALQIETS